MEKRSTHYGDVTKWIEKVIDSCETHIHLSTAQTLVRNFRSQLMKNSPDKYWNNYLYDVIWPLENKIHSKRRDLLNNRLNGK
jgi:hypothetical protein